MCAMTDELNVEMEPTYIVILTLLIMFTEMAISLSSMGYSNNRNVSQKFMVVCGMCCHLKWSFYSFYLKKNKKAKNKLRINQYDNSNALRLKLYLVR